MKLRASKLLIFTVLITLALIAALTVPSEQSHYAKLNSSYPRFNGLLFTDAVKDAEQSNSTKRHNVHLSYWNFGVASAVTSYPLYVPCPVGVTDRLLSYGFFGFVFLKNPPTDQPPDSKAESLTQAKPTPSTYVIESGSDATPDDAAKFFAAYKDFQKGERLVREGRRKEANEKFLGVLEQLEQIKAQSPEWQPMVVDFRLKRTREYLDSLSKQTP